MKRLILLAAAMAAALVLGACGGNAGSPADYPQDFRVTAGDASVTITWTAEPEVEYWIFYGPGANITTANWATSGGRALTRVSSPTIITGLLNGATYSFTINGRKNNGPGGSGAPTQVVTPKQAGDNWAPGAPIGTARLNSVGAGTGSLGYSVVTVGQDGGIYSSVSGGAYTARTNPIPNVPLNAVWIGTLGFVAGGAGGTVLYSLDATTWTQKTSGTTQTIYGGVSSISNYVAVGAGGLVLTSSDGSTWTTPNTGQTSDLYAVTYGFGRFVAVGAGGLIMDSSDGNSWSPAPNVPTTNDLYGVAYGLVASADGTTSTNAFVAVGKGGTVLASQDGVVWATVTPFTTVDLLGAVNGGRFVAVGTGGSIFTSLDGLSWVSRPSGTTADLRSVVRTIGGYTAVGDAGTNVSTY